MESLYTSTPIYASLPFRLGVSVLIFFLVVWMPWWLTFITTFVLTLLFSMYELVVVGLFLDSIYVVPSYHIFHFIEFPFTIVLLVCISTSLFVRRILRRV